MQLAYVYTKSQFTQAKVAAKLIPEILPRFRSAVMEVF